MRSKKLFSNIFLFFLLSSVLFGNILNEASQLENEGEMIKARLLYIDWLRANDSDPRFFSILLHTAHMNSEIEEVVSLLLEFESLISPLDKSRYYLEIARIYELSFQISKAADFYKKASEKKNGNINYEHYLKWLLLSYETGNIPDLADVDQILLSNPDTRLYVDALIFKSELLKYEEDYTTAESILLQSSYTGQFPEIYLALWDLYLLTDNISGAENIYAILKRDYSDSIELQIMNRTLKRSPRLSFFFLGHTSQSHFTYIQTGSYARKEYADIQVRKLKEKGFKTFVIRYGTIIKVIVQDSVSADDLLARLRSYGFEGFQVSHQPPPD